jgi:hypothetical protein
MLQSQFQSQSTSRTNADLMNEHLWDPFRILIDARELTRPSHGPLLFARRGRTTWIQEFQRRLEPGVVACSKLLKPKAIVTEGV